MEERKVALVTGAGTGIGKAIARAFGQKGYDVVVHYRDAPEAADELVREIEGMGRQSVGIYAELMDDTAPAKLVDDAFVRMGRLDVVVNNAGITVFEPTVSVTEDQFERVFRTDFRAPYLISQRAIQVMQDTGTKGSIVQITSVHQERVNHGDSLYGSMKAALARATESMAFEAGPKGIRVNAIAPGLTLSWKTRPGFEQRLQQIEQAIPLRRAGRVEDIASAAVWLASDEASYITGITLRVDGGMNLPLTRALVDGQMQFF